MNSLTERALYISTHQGYKVLASLIVSRLPLSFNEPAGLKEFREFRESWTFKVGAAPRLDDALVYMRLPSHFLPSSEDRYRKKVSVHEAVTHDELQEGFRVGVKKAVKQLSLNKVVDKQVLKVDSGLKSLERKEKDLLHLIVKYKNSSVWTFPWGHRFNEQSMRHTINRISQEQLPQLNTFLLGNCPAGFRKLKDERNSKLGAKIFYYKSLWVPGSPNLEISDQIQDFAWLTRSELKDHLPLLTWSAIAPIIPLNAC